MHNKKAGLKSSAIYSQLTKSHSFVAGITFSFFKLCSSSISFNSSSILSAFPANIIPSRLDHTPPLTAETAVVTLSFKSSLFSVVYF